MAGNTFGKSLKITTFGESHGPAIGVVLDGFPAGMELDVQDLLPYLERRRPGNAAVSSARKEEDLPEILSGVFEGKTTGTPIAVIVRNQDSRSGDYDALRDVYRPGHADYTYHQKYDFRDHRGGGRSSGRETIGRVIAGGICEIFLRKMGMEVNAYTYSIGPVECKADPLDYKEALRNETRMPDKEANEEALTYIASLKEKGDSCGGVIACRIAGVMAGLGEPVFDKLDADLAKALMSIGAVKAVEIGAGTQVSRMTGSENNDAFGMNLYGVSKKTNHAGGILGGISDGDIIELKVHVKPTPSISVTQHTVSTEGEEREISIHGRHDPVIVPRAVVVVEAMCAITIMDALLTNMHARSEKIFDFYNREDH
ncbi:MAG: chorismate synthase [Lachnospiraceae bacterium]|nr:chorismate synthase [Lachnospiraceae bacterium]